MKILSWNVNGIRAILKKDFIKDIKQLDPDIICIQETKAQDHETEKELSVLTGYTLYSNSAFKKGYSGTAILSKKKPVAFINDMGNSNNVQSTTNTILSMSMSRIPDKN